MGGLGRAALFVGLFILALTPVLTTPVLPMIDYYNHFARYYVLSHVGADSFLAQNYEPRWGILPNIGMDVLGVGLTAVAPALASAKALVILILGVQYSGLLYFSRQLTGRSSILVALLGLPLLYSFIFTWGFANFLLGLGLALWAAGWWLANRHRPALAIPVSCLLAVIVFLTHGVAFALYGLLLGGLELGFFICDGRRSILGLVKSMAGLAVQAVAPVVLFAMSPTSNSADGVSNADESVRALAHQGRLTERLWQLGQYRLGTIVRVADSPYLWLDIATFVVALGVIGVLVVRRRAAVAPVAWPAIGIGALLVAATPPTLFGVGYVADRMPLFLALVVTASLAYDWKRARLDVLCIGGLAFMAILRTGAITVGWQPYREDLPAMLRVIAQAPRQSVVDYVNLANDGRNDPRPRCDMYGPLTIPLAGQASPLFAFGGQQPIALTGRLRAATDSVPIPSETADAGPLRASHHLANTARGDFDYVLVCSPERMILELPDTARLVARDGRFALYRLPHADKASAPTR